MTNKLKELLDKIKSGTKLTEDEISTLVWDTPHIDEIYGDYHRWQREVKTVIEIGVIYIAIDWLEGLTENCESEYPNQPYIVEPKTYTKTIIVTDWIPQNDQ